jgi:two-component system sensor histidine kinase DesK
MRTAAAGPFGFSRGWGWLLAAVWLFYLGQPLATILDRPAGAAKFVALAGLLAFAATYVGAFVWMRSHRLDQKEFPPGHAWSWLAGLFALSLLTIPAAGGDWLVTLVYMGAVAMMALPPRVGIVVVVVLATAAAVLPAIVPGWQHEAGVVFGVVLAAFATFGVSRLADHNARLTAAQNEIARLAVAEERARAARDLHDILGHSLTVIAVKAELAGRLLPLDPTRAAAEVDDVEKLAREALADIRGTVGAYRAVTLEEELASARTALYAAGITADVPATVDELPPARGELFGWAVREGVTNVVRHSGASKAVIRVRPDQVEIVDDGRGPLAPPSGTAGPSGHGLTGLRERAARLGGTVTVGRAAGEKGFLLRVSVPA